MRTILVMVVLLVCVQVVSAVEYTVTDLGTLGGSSSRAYGINNKGQVVGGSTTTSNSMPDHAFLYQNGAMQDLGTISGPNSVASGINDSGQIIGSSDMLIPPSTIATWTRPAVYLNGSIQDLGTLGGNYGYAKTINSSGVIAGRSGNPDGSGGSFHAFLWSNGAMQDLGTLGGDQSEARGINSSGHVVGWSFDAAGGDHRAFLYSNGRMSDIGNLGGAIPWGGRSVANGINDSDQIVGLSWPLGIDTDHAFLYSNGSMQDLGTLGGSTSCAMGINNKGFVVGGSSIDFTSTYYGVGGVNHAFLYANGSMRDLNNLIDPSSGFTLTEASAINDADQIVGYGTNLLGQERAFLLTPTPEPASLVLLGFGALALVRKRRC